MRYLKLTTNSQVTAKKNVVVYKFGDTVIDYLLEQIHAQAVTRQGAACEILVHGT